MVGASVDVVTEEVEVVAGQQELVQPGRERSVCLKVLIIDRGRP